MPVRSTYACVEKQFDPLLVEIVRESERVVDHQIKAAEESDDKNEHLTSLGVALVGAEVAAYAYVRGSVPENSSVMIVLPAAIVLALAALTAFLDAYVGIARRIRFHAGPHPEWLAAKANESSWSPNLHLVATASSFARYFNANTASLAAANRSRRLGLALLVASTALAAGGTLYLLT